MRILITVLITLFTLPLSAQNYDDEVTRDEIVVTANRLPTGSDQVGSAVTIIDGDDLASATTVSDVLKYQPGVQLDRSGPTGAITSIRIRGTESDHTIVLIDGVRVGDPSSNGAFDFAHLMPSNIDRIEIVRGAQSVLYGSDAIGGVINIITKTGDAKPTFNIALESGSLNTRTLNADANGRSGRLQWSLGFYAHETGGVSAAAEKDENTERDGYENITFNTNLSLHLSDTLTLNMVGRRSDATTNYDGGFPFGDNDDYSDVLETMGKVALNHDLGRFKHSLTLGLNRNDRENFGSGPGTFDGKTQQVSWLVDYAVNDIFTIVAGLDRTKESTKQTSFGSTIRESVLTKSGFLSINGDVGENFSFTLGGRLDDHEKFGNHSTWRATASYHMTGNLRLHSSIGTGFNAPTLFELYHPLYGNEDLNPERSIGGDFGVTWENDNLEYDVTGFYNRYKDKIGSDPTTFRSINEVGATDAYGVESSVKAQLHETLFFNLSHTYTHTEKNTLRRPKHMVKGGVTYQPFENLTFDVSMNGRSKTLDVGSTKIPGYGLWNAKASWEFMPNVSLYARGENLTDKDWTDVNTYGQPGRTGYLGLKASF